MYPDNAVAVILRPFSAKIRTSILSVYPLFRSAHSSGNTARTIPPIMYEAGCGGGSFAFSLRNARSSSTLCDESACTLRRASFSIHKHGNTIYLYVSNVYDDYSEETGKRHGKVGAVHTNPCGVSRRPPPFLQSACGYSEKWLRILLRASPRDPTTFSEIGHAKTQKSTQCHVTNRHSCHGRRKDNILHTSEPSCAHTQRIHSPRCFGHTHPITNTHGCNLGSESPGWSAKTLS